MVKNYAVIGGKIAELKEEIHRHSSALQETIHERFDDLQYASNVNAGQTDTKLNILESLVLQLLNKTKISNKINNNKNDVLIKEVENNDSKVSNYSDINNKMKNNKIGDTTIITISNYGFVNFTLNWIIHLEKLNINKFIVFCYDTAIFNFLKEKKHANNLVMVPSEWLDYKISSSYSNWESSDYKKITQSKTNIWYHLAKLGHNFIFSDPDVVWLKDYSI